MTSRSGTTRRPPRQRGHDVRWLACGAAAWGALAFGAVYPWAYWPLAVACATAGILGLRSRGRIVVPDGGRLLTAALALVAIAALLQLVPWPRAWLERLNPHGVRLIEQLDVRFALGAASTHALSVDPMATARALVLYVCFALLVVGLARALSRGGAPRLIWVISILGAVVALAGIVQRPLYDGAIYGFWTPVSSGTPFGPFVNKNHFAGWMVMAIPLALGGLCAAFSEARARVRPTLQQRVIWLASRNANRAIQMGCAVVLMGFALVMTLSRSGMLSLAVVLILFGAAAVRRRDGALGRSVVVSCVALASAFAVFWTGTEAVTARFAAADTVELGGRIPIWRGAVQGLEAFWLTGSGLNTYSVTTLFHPAVIPGRHVAEAHNDYLQLGVEGGMLLGVPVAFAVAAFAFAVWRAFQATDGPTYWARLGAVTGIVGIAIQSLVEFSLQIPGNAVLFSILCAVALHRGPDPPSSRIPQSS